jgi:quercetin dioxygenase-like cupin family protein
MIADLEAEGLTVAEWTDEPSTHYPPHAHRRDEVLVVLDGSMTMVVEGIERRLGPGDRLELPAGARHTATVGPAGARYLVGRR